MDPHRLRRQCGIMSPYMQAAIQISEMITFGQQSCAQTTLVNSYLPGLPRTSCALVLKHRWIEYITHKTSLHLKRVDLDIMTMNDVCIDNDSKKKTDRRKSLITLLKKRDYNSDPKEKGIGKHLTFPEMCRGQEGVCQCE